MEGQPARQAALAAGGAAPRAGRDPEEFEISMITWEPDRDLARRYEEAGAHRFIIQTQQLADERQATETLERIALTMGL